MRPTKNEYKTLRLVLGDQLNYQHSWYKKVDDSVLYVLMEVRQETDYVVHHIQKVIAFFGAMYNFARWLTKNHHEVYYIKINDTENLQSIPKNLEWLIEKFKISHFEYQEPDEYRLDQQFKDWLKKKSISYKVYLTEHFITERDTLKNFFAGKERFLNESYYRFLRKKTGILMTNGKPYGGKWNYDFENRKKFNREIEVPLPKLRSKNLSDIYQEIKKAGIETIGTVEAEDFKFPLTRKESSQLLEDFVVNRLPYFGPYQDAMDRDYWLLFHSMLSFSLNTKMLSPLEVIKAAEEAFYRNPQRYSLPSVEGFIRQVLGWREYVRGIYWALMPGYRNLNYFGHKNPLPEFYWTGETKMECLKIAIKASLDRAYAHHIQRLMITGSFALLAGVHPEEVNKWYLGIYANAIEWVQLPNTSGMSQFADGGVMATKPYVSSANYIHKMSNYCEKCYYNRQLKYGERACPFNSLYWHFLDRNHRLLGNNPRMSNVYGLWDRTSAQEKKKILKQADSYLSRINSL